VEVKKKDIFDIEGKWDRVICGELLEHLECPDELLKKLDSLISTEGKIFLTAAIWAASIDHIYLFKSAKEVRELLNKYFKIERELVLNVFSNKKSEDERTPINYACILSKK
jgi:cyclopropane fatty-acyl-phospholipid synthase-like methyltransferase